VKSVVAGGAVGLAAVFSPGLSEPAAAVAQSLEEITSDLIICKVSEGDPSHLARRCCSKFYGS